MPYSLQLLPCNRVPIYECLNDNCDQCIKLLAELSDEPSLMEEDLERNIVSIKKTVIPTI
jgi:hypothetical protein